MKHKRSDLEGRLFPPHLRPGINPACRRALCIRNSRLFSVRFAQQLPSFWASRRQSGSYPQTRSRLLAQNKVAPITESVAAFYGALPATPPMLATVSPFFIEGTAHTYRTTPARRRTRFPHRLAEQIGDVADFHALLHVPAALDHGIENAGGFAGDAGNALGPHWVLHRRYIARQHLQVAHHVQAAVDQRRHVFRLYGASMARLGREGRLLPQAGIGLQKASGVRIAGAIG